MVVLDDSYKFDKTTKLDGRKPKFKLNKDGKSYIFKYGSQNNEIFAELIAEQLGLQVGINMAHYQIAEYNGCSGVLSDYFLQDDERFISSKQLIKYTNELLYENGILTTLKGNTINNICQSLKSYFTLYNYQDIEKELLLRWAFYGLITECDKNDTNIGFIIDAKKGIVKLSPDYDNSTMALLDSNIDNYISKLRRGASIYNIIDEVTNDLHPMEYNSKSFIEEFNQFIELSPVYADEIMKSLAKIDVDLAIETVERENDVEIPWNVKYWVRQVISARYNDMTRFYSNANESNYKKFTK